MYRDLPIRGAQTRGSCDDGVRSVAWAKHVAFYYYRAGMPEGKHCRRGMDLGGGGTVRCRRSAETAAKAPRGDGAPVARAVRARSTRGTPRTRPRRCPTAPQSPRPSGALPSQRADLPRVKRTGVMGFRASGNPRDALPWGVKQGSVLTEVHSSASPSRGDCHCRMLESAPPVTNLRPAIHASAATGPSCSRDHEPRPAPSCAASTPTGCFRPCSGRSPTKIEPSSKVAATCPPEGLMATASAMRWMT